MHLITRRNFLKSGIKYSSVLVSSLVFFTNSYINKKIKFLKRKIYKKKFSKVWILEINDS